MAAPVAEFVTVPLIVPVVGDAVKNSPIEGAVEPAPGHELIAIPSASQLSRSVLWNW